MTKEISKFWSGEAKDYNLCTEAEFNDKRAVNGWKKLLGQALENKRNLKALEVGTGTGFLATLLHQMGQCVVGVDIAEGMLETAKNNALKRGVDIEFHIADAVDLKAFENDEFDAIICRHVVWTLPEPEEAFKEWYRVLRPGGKLIIFDDNSFNNLKSPFRRIWRIFAWMLIYLSEGHRKPWKNRKKELRVNVSDFNYKVRPEEDQNILKKCGYDIILVKANISRIVRNFFSYLKTGFWGPVFMIVAQKPINKAK